MPKNRATTWQILSAYGKAIWRYPATLLTVWGSIVAAVTVTVLIPLYYKEFFDALTNQPISDDLARTLLNIVLKVLTLNGVMWLCWRTATFVNNWHQTKVSVNLKREAFEHLLKHSYHFFSNNFGGALVQKVNRFSRSFEAMFESFIWTLLPLATRMVAMTIVLWFYNRYIALILLVWMFAFIVMNLLLSQWKIKYDLTAAEQDSETTGTLADAITNHTNIQLFSAFDRELSLFRKVTETLRLKLKKAWDVDTVIEALQSFFMIVAEFLLFYYAIKYWRVGIVTVGMFALIQAYLGQLFSQMWDFGRTIRYVYRSIADAEEMVAILNTDHEVKDIPAAKALHIKRGEIEFRDVQFSFNETRTVLKKLNLKISSGEKVALIGASGAGKSTMVKVLLRLYDLEAGTILIDGQDIHTITQHSLRENLSLVPQDPILFHRTLLENIRYGKENASQKEVERAAELAYCKQFIDLLPETYNTYVGERGIKLSGGERQRIAIARAILKNAPILILDEATSSLDSHSEKLIQNALKNLMQGKTVIVIAHRLSTIQTMDRIIVMDKGCIKEEGTHAELLKKRNSLYAQLWKIQAGGFLIPKE